MLFPACKVIAAIAIELSVFNMEATKAIHLATLIHIVLRVSRDGLEPPALALLAPRSTN